MNRKGILRGPFFSVSMSRRLLSNSYNEYSGTLYRALPERQFSRKLLKYVKYDEKRWDLVWIRKPSNRVRVGEKVGKNSSNRSRFVIKRKAYFSDEVIYWIHNRDASFKGKYLVHLDDDQSNNSIEILRLFTQEEYHHYQQNYLWFMEEYSIPFSS